jgi:hypothetical protein
MANYARIVVAGCERFLTAGVLHRAGLRSGMPEAAKAFASPL